MAKLQGWRIDFVVFMLFVVTAIAAPAQTFTTLASFDGTNGSDPNARLTQGTDGNFYGVTPSGGANGYGTVFKITPTGTLTTLYDFCKTLPGCLNGALPSSGLALATDGNFYGVTKYGGKYTIEPCAHQPSHCGTMFKITPAGSLTTLLDFPVNDSVHGGAEPSELVLAANGNFYVAALIGNSDGLVTSGVWEITPEGTVIGGGGGSYSIIDELVEGVDGNIYGTSHAISIYHFSTIFKINGANLYRFHVSDPSIRVTQGTDGNFYGVMSNTIFKLTPKGTLTTLYTFVCSPTCLDGSSPNALIQATDGNFYGTTADGGANGYGTIFQVTPAGALTTLYSFCSQSNCADGSAPIAALIQGTNGNFYGTTSIGGTNGDGAVFSLATGLGPFVAFVRGSGKVGWKVEILGQGFTGTTGVSFNGSAANFTVQSDTYLTATVPQGATTGFVTVTTPGGTLQSNVVFRVTP